MITVIVRACLLGVIALSWIDRAAAVPAAVFTASPNPALTGQEISFDPSSSLETDPLRSLVAFAFDFDFDGTFDADVSGASPVVIQHAFNLSGVHDVALRVTNDQGAFGISVASVTVVGDDIIVPTPEPSSIIGLVSLLGSGLLFSRVRRRR